MRFRLSLVSFCFVGHLVGTGRVKERVELEMGNLGGVTKETRKG